MPAPPVSAVRSSGRRLRTLIAVSVVLAVACTGEPALPDWATATALPADPLDPAATAVPADPTPVPLDQAAQHDQTDEPDLGPDLRVLQLAADDPVRLTTQEGDRSWSMAVTATDADDLVGISQVVDPEGTLRYAADLRHELLLVDELHPRVLADAGAVGLYVTTATDQPLPPGVWEVTIASNAGRPDVRAAIRSGDPGRAHRLDVAVWSTARLADPDVLAAAWRAQMDATLTPHDLAVGRLDVVVAGEEGAPHRSLGIDGLAEEVHDACTAAAAATDAHPRTAVVVLAERIGEGVLTAGLDPATGPVIFRPDGEIDGYVVATPGTPVLGPASHACAAVSARDDAEAQGLVALHEILHLAGLTRHTTERNGRAFDNLPDTPECPASQFDTDRDGQVSRDECEGRGAENLMFWQAGGTALTRDQAWRVRTHPLARPVED